MPSDHMTWFCWQDLASDVASRVQQRKDVVRSAFDALCSADGSSEAPIDVDADTAMVDGSEGVRFLDSESLAAWVNTSGEGHSHSAILLIRSTSLIPYLWQLVATHALLCIAVDLTGSQILQATSRSCSRETQKIQSP